MKYLSRPYKIIRSEEKPLNNILLVLQGYGDTEEFMSLLLIPHHLRRTFQEVKRRECRNKIKIFWL